MILAIAFWTGETTPDGSGTNWAFDRYCWALPPVGELAEQIQGSTRNEC